MQAQKIHTDKAPAAVGPYSQAMVSGNMVYTSGQIPLDPQSGAVVGQEITAQTDQVLVNLSEVLLAAGANLSCIVKTTCFITDMADFADFNKVYERYIAHAPARSCVAVKELPKGVMVEIEAIAQVP